MNKVYISGQISGLTVDEVSDNFGRAEAFLIDGGSDPVNPLKVVACEAEDCNPDNHGGPREGHVGYLHHWQCYMRYDIIEMLEKCDTILMLPNWQVSSGANLEKLIAVSCGFNVWYLHENYKQFVTSGGLV